MSSEDRYIKDRLNRAEELSALFRRMQKYPVKDNKITFSTFEGAGGFCCNPRYIAEALHEMQPDVEMVWLTNKQDAHFPEYIKVFEYNEDHTKVTVTGKIIRPAYPRRWNNLH